MKSKKLFQVLVAAVMIVAVMLPACDNGGGVSPEDKLPSESEFKDHLTNQVNEVIIPTMVTYREKMDAFQTALSGFASSIDEANLNKLRSAYQEAYLAYQAAAVHNFYATSTQSLVDRSNLFPVDTTLLSELIGNESYSFNTTAQERANGFPAIDFMLFGPKDVVAYFGEDAKRMAFLDALVGDMRSRAQTIEDQWSGNLKTNFINNGGTQLGSSLSVQLNESIVYYEDHIRENKVGIPIGRLGPNDSPIPADATKIEAYYQSLAEGNENFTLQLLKASIEEMEDMYLGETFDGTDGQGFDNLLTSIEQNSIDSDIKLQFDEIYELISSRSSISGDETLYNSVQALVTLFKSDLFPVLNVQDADGGNDGD
ncbi:MAG: imelysin family protein [Bacteroidota bacterium]